MEEALPEQDKNHQTSGVKQVVIDGGVLKPKALLHPVRRNCVVTKSESNHRPYSGHYAEFAAQAGT
jgi:hypothetical protein